MRVGDVFRVPLSSSDRRQLIDDLPNLFEVTRSAAGRAIPFSKGINKIAASKGADRVPAVLIRSSSHKAGTEVTPWQDRFEPDRGHARYFGDNKLTTGLPAHESDGNKLLLHLFRSHTSLDSAERHRAMPLIFFEGDRKGRVAFQGYGILLRAELVTQLDPRTKRPFSNYMYDCMVMSLAAENEEFDWSWIEARRDPTKTDEECLRIAPAAWRDWVEHGDNAHTRVRRRLTTLMTTRPELQRPSPGSREHKILEAIYDHYRGRKTQFEALAAAVAERVLSGSGAAYQHGWVTRGATDEGIDFVGRLDVGDGFSRVGLVVLGQAKCEKLNQPTNGTHIARTVARLRRGWLGVYVTTSYFSPQSQREIFDDRYPIVLIPGRRVAEEVHAMLQEQKLTDLSQLLKQVDHTYGPIVELSDPEAVLQVI